MSPAIPAQHIKRDRLLEIAGVRTYFLLDEGVVKAVDGVDMTIRTHETVGIIGESGSGKSTLAHSLLRLVSSPGEIVDGDAILRRKDGTDVNLFALKPSSPELRSVRGDDVAMVFQEPMTSFSPVHTIGSQIGEMLQQHTDLDRDEIRDRVITLLRRVGISDPERRIDQYPHEYSGGMRQRAMIAMALSCQPSLLIADEPTTALDVTIQAQILTLLKTLQREDGLSILYITHNLGVVQESVDRVYVMYLGRIVESAPTDELFTNPLHPYTRKLLRSVPQPGQRHSRLETVPGSVPTPMGMPPQCGFASRCEFFMAGICDADVPALDELEEEHFVRCFLHSDRKEPRDDWSTI